MVRPRALFVVALASACGAPPTPAEPPPSATATAPVRTTEAAPPAAERPTTPFFPRILHAGSSFSFHPLKTGGIAIEAWALREAPVKVTEGVFTYVAIDEKGGKRPVPPA